MKAFAALYEALDATTSTTAKLAALSRYFREAPPADAAWAAFLLSGRRILRLVSVARLRDWAAAASGLPGWLFEECHATVGDLAETAALLVGGERLAATPGERSLREWMDERVRPLAQLPPETQRQRVHEAWSALTRSERYLYNKLLTGGFRVGVSETLVVRAIALSYDLPAATVTRRLMGPWQPDDHAWARIVAPGGDGPEGDEPYPFFLASPLDGDPAELGDLGEWLVEWKWDGIRAQLVGRASRALWSRGEELVTPRYPEIVQAAQSLPDGFVIDGEIVAFENGRPLPFAALQTRIGRRQVTLADRARAPVRFVAFDLLEHAGEDVRSLPLRERRARLERILAAAPGALVVSEAVAASSWDELARARASSRERGVEGVLLKRLASPYGVGRRRGDWWKWKIDPWTMDTVLFYAQPGHGRRAGLYTDYTFAVWDGEELVPIAKAYSGLTQPEIDELDRWIRTHTIERFGPVRAVQPVRVFELAFEAIQASGRHRGGVAVRFPRILRERTDKRPEEADRIDRLRALAGVTSAAPARAIQTELLAELDPPSDA